MVAIPSYILLSWIFNAYGKHGYGYYVNSMDNSSPVISENVFRLLMFGFCFVIVKASEFWSRAMGAPDIPQKSEDHT